MGNKNKIVVIDASAESQDPFQFLTDVTRQHGDAVQYTGPLGDAFLLNSPSYIRQVLQNSQLQRTTLAKIVLGDSMLSSDGPSWREKRRRATPFFTRDAVNKFEPLIQERTRSMLVNWEDISSCGESLDVSEEMANLTLQIIVNALFGVGFSSKMSELAPALVVLLDEMGAMACSQLNTPLTFSAVGAVRFNAARATVDEIVADIIADRRQNADDPSDLLSSLLSVRDEETGKPLTDREIRDEVVTQLIAGHETTSLVLSWAWDLLSANPDAESRLHLELDQVLGGREPGIADLAQLPQAMMVLQESMRLYPPVWFLAKKSLAAVEVEGILIPENALVIVSPYAMHRHSGYWQNPGQFDPQRFSSGAQQVKYSYMPFGGGQHLCVGMNLALLEGHLIMAMIAQKFSIRPLADHIAVPQPSITLRMRDGLPATLVRREEAAQQ
jgi:cytochrome P450